MNDYANYKPRNRFSFKTRIYRFIQSLKRKVQYAS